MCVGVSVNLGVQWIYETHNTRVRSEELRVYGYDLIS